MKNKYKLVLGVLIFLMGVNRATAQLNPLGSQYYSNQYIINPAFAGADNGLRLNVAYKKLWSGMPGAPLTQNITIDHGMGRVGLGLNVNNESAGLLKQTRVMGTYAYHLPLDSGTNKLSFGLSLGIMNQRLDNSGINGNPNDVLVGEYNGRKTYFDGDFGIAYTSGKLNIQAAVPNLKSFLQRDVVKVANVPTFYTAISYNISFKSGVELEPKVAYRGIKGYDNLYDVGGQLALANRKIMLMGLYHSNESASFGLGLDFMKKYLISGMYTTQNAALGNYVNGSFELNLRIDFGK